MNKIKRSGILGEINMKIRIVSTEVSISRNYNTQWDRLWQYNQHNHLDSIGIFWLKNNGTLYGGWINFPLHASVSFELKISSYSLRRINPATILEFFIETEAQFNTIAYQLQEYQQNWTLSATYPKTPIYYNPVKAIHSQLNEFIQQVEDWMLQAEESLTFEEIDKIDFRIYQQQFQQYETFLSFKGLPEQLTNESDRMQIYTQLAKLKQEFQSDKLKQLAVSRELAQHNKKYRKEWDAYKGLNQLLTSVDYQQMITQIRDDLLEFQQFKNENSRFYQNSKKLVEKIDRLSTEYNKFIQQVEQEQKQAKFQEELRQKTLEQDQIVLEQLKQFNPGVQTLLARISELTKIELSLAEQSIVRLLEESADLGTYDSMSQVFIPGNEITKRIDELLQKFEEDTYYKK